MADSQSIAMAVIVVAAIGGLFVHGGGGSRYDDRQESAYEAEPPIFDGCTSDCSGHQAGFDWAEENSIRNPDDCSGKSESFIEGCKLYAAASADPISLEDAAAEAENAAAESEQEYLHQ